MRLTIVAVGQKVPDWAQTAYDDYAKRFPPELKVELKAVKAVFASLEATILASLHKKGLGSFTLPGLLKVNVVNVPAKKKRTGIDPFTKQERVFAAKAATVKIKTRALKKLKDAAA